MIHRYGWFIPIHLEFICTSELTTCLCSTSSITSGEFVGVPQVTIAVGVHVTVIRNLVFLRIIMIILSVPTI